MSFRLLVVEISHVEGWTQKIQFRDRGITRAIFIENGNKLNFCIFAYCVAVDAWICNRASSMTLQRPKVHGKVLAVYSSFSTEDLCFPIAFSASKTFLLYPSPY